MSVQFCCRSPIASCYRLTFRRYFCPIAMTSVLSLRLLSFAMTSRIRRRARLVSPQILEIEVD